MREKEFLPLVSERLGIKELNDMQRKMLEAVTQSGDIILLSPTGSGKTLAFALPVLKLLKPASGRVQVLVMAPSRELVIQIAGVFRAIAATYKCTALYGGHNVEDEVNELRETPDIVVATPGRLLDHVKRRNIDLLPCRILVLDEFDKSLELGFEKEMSKVFLHLKNVSRILLTSATHTDMLPEFLKLKSPRTFSYLEDNKQLRSRIRVHRVESGGKDKLQTLLALLYNMAGGSSLGKTIIFVNHRESAERVAKFLRNSGASAVLYHGALDQREREKALALFRNESRPVLVSTDLGARGLDIEGVEHVVHYHIPISSEAYTHRNGRTARVDRDGQVFVIVGPEEDLPGFVTIDDNYHIDAGVTANLASGYDTVYIGAGKKEKLSKGDIIGWLTKNCSVDGKSVGRIDVADHYSLVSLPVDVAAGILKEGCNQRIKGQKQRVELVR